MISTLSSDVGGLAILSFPELLSGLGVPLLLLLLGSYLMVSKLKLKKL